MNFHLSLLLAFAIALIGHNEQHALAFISKEDRRALFNFSVDLKPDRVLSVGSNLTVICTANSPAALAWMPQLMVRQSKPHKLFRTEIAPDGLSGSVSIANVSDQLNQSDFECVGSNGTVYLSLHKELVVGYPPVMPRFTFFWVNRENFTSIATPPLPDVQLRAGLPVADGGRLKLWVAYADSFTGPAGRNCSVVDKDLPVTTPAPPITDRACSCDAKGFCDWGSVRQNMLSENVTMNITLCNERGWCADQLTMTFDRRGMELPLPVGDLRASFSTAGVAVTYREPTGTTEDQNYTYLVELLQDGTSPLLVASRLTNETRVNFTRTDGVHPDTGYSVRVVCRPRYFVGYVSQAVHVTGRTPEAAPCGPPALALWLPAAMESGAALPPAECRYGTIQRIEVRSDSGPIMRVPVPAGAEFVAWNSSSRPLLVAAATAAGVGPWTGNFMQAAWLPDCGLEARAVDFEEELLDVGNGSFAWRPGSAGQQRVRVAICETASTGAASGDRSLAACLRIRQKLEADANDASRIFNYALQLLLHPELAVVPKACVCHVSVGDNVSPRSPRLNVSLLTRRVGGSGGGGGASAEEIIIAETNSCRGHPLVDRYELRAKAEAASASSAKNFSCQLISPRRFACSRRPGNDPAPPGLYEVQGWLRGRLVFSEQIQLPPPPADNIWTILLAAIGGGLLVAVAAVVGICALKKLRPSGHLSVPPPRNYQTPLEAEERARLTEEGDVGVGSVPETAETVLSAENGYGGRTGSGNNNGSWEIIVPAAETSNGVNGSHQVIESPSYVSNSAAEAANVHVYTSRSPEATDSTAPIL